MIPNYQQFMRPFLEVAQAANGNEVKLRNVINELADKFNLTEEDKTETLLSGKQSILDKTMIKNSLEWLPQDPYPDDELANLNLVVYQHVYANYQGAGNSTYGAF